MNRLQQAWQLGRTWIALVGLHYALKRHGFHKLFPHYVDRYQIPDGRRPHPRWRLEGPQVLSLVHLACRLVPFEAQCLHRAFLGYRMLRTQLNLPVEMVVGVRKFPWYAHAWLELNGFRLDEEIALIDSLTVILNSGRRAK